jgi:hypothetical protein
VEVKTEPEKRQGGISGISSWRGLRLPFCGAVSTYPYQFVALRPGFLDIPKMHECRRTAFSCDFQRPQHGTTPANNNLSSSPQLLYKYL